MKNTFYNIVTRFLRSFWVGQIMLLLYWIVVVKYGIDRIDSVETIYIAAAMSIAVLFVVQTASAILSCVIEARAKEHRKRANAICSFILLIVGVGASYIGWTVLSAAINLHISAGTLAFASSITAVSLTALTLSVEAVLGQYLGRSN